MYQAFYQLTMPPFGITPDPEFLYLSPSHREALGSITYGVEQRKGFVVVLGEVGLGKTTILRSYLDGYDRRQLTLVYIFNANVTFKALLDTIFSDLDIHDQPDDVYGMVSRLHRVVVEEYQQGRNVVLIVDEVQNMPIETLEQLRVLSNLETSTDKLLQIVLVGQPEFAETLNRHDLRQLRQRIAVRCTLAPFTDHESLAYIDHRLHTAGSSSSSLFTRAARRRIIRHANGVPRALNIVCDNALVTGLGYQKRLVTTAIVKEVIRDLEGRTRVGGHRWAWTSISALLVMAAITLVLFYPTLPTSDPVGGRRLPSSEPAMATRAIESALDIALPPGGVRKEAAGEPAPPVPDAAALSEPAPKPMTERVVREGDGLVRLTRDVYGIATLRVLQRVINSNPNITDVNHIEIGTLIRFPAIADLQAKESGPASGSGVRP